MKALFCTYTFTLRIGKRTESPDVVVLSFEIDVGSPLSTRLVIHNTLDASLAVALHTAIEGVLPLLGFT